MPQYPTAAAPRTFWCFISYRHADNKEPGRQWASWLHHALETYEVPSDLVGTTNERGDILPERIYPVFRDEDELPVDADLASPIFRALDASKFLLVICSPRAVQSNYVAQEIRYFKQLGREDRVLAAMVDGIPNARIDATKNPQPLECFPEPLRHRVDQQGNLLEELAEPVAADFRLDDASEGWCSPEAYRQALKNAASLTNAQIEQRVVAYQQRCDLMKLKIVAGVLGVPLGTLTQRDKAYQLALARKRARRLRQWLAAVAVLGIFAIAGAIIASQQARIAREKTILAEEQAVIARQQSKIAQEQTVVAEQQRTVAQQQTTIATENLTLARKRLAETFYKEASRLIQGPAGAILPAVESLVASLESAPDHGPSKRMLEYEMATREWVVPIAKVTVAEDIKNAWLNQSGGQALILDANAQLHFFDLNQGKQILTTDLSKQLPKGTAIISAACSPSQQNIALLCHVPRSRTLTTEYGNKQLDWSWQLFVFQRDGTLLGTDLLVAINRDGESNSYFAPCSDRLADQPLFFAHDQLLLFINEREINGWNAPAGAGSLRFLGAQVIPVLSPDNQEERLAGWHYNASTHTIQFMTNRHILEQKVTDGSLLKRHSFATEPLEMSPSPDDFSGMVSFGTGVQAAISGLVDVSYQMPEGIGVGLPTKITSATEQYSKTYASYNGVFQFTKNGGWMHFNDQLFQYSAKNQSNDIKGNFEISFPTNERITEWPPFLMRDFTDSVLLLSIVQSGSATPQLLEIVRKPKPDEKSIDIPKHRGISQILDGITCWIATDGTKLAQINGSSLLLYRTNWRAKGATPHAPANQNSPLSFSAYDLEAGKSTTPFPKLTWDTSGATATLKVDGKSFVIPERLKTEQAIANYFFPTANVRLVVFQESKSMNKENYTPEYETRLRLWTIHLDSNTTHLSDWVYSFSVDSSESLLATCDGTKVRLSHLADDKEISAFSPRRLSNHMSAPAQSVFFSYDSQVLGVGSLLSYQDVAFSHRAFDVETGNEYLLSRSGYTPWHFDLFPNPKKHQIQEWYEGVVPQQKIPFFVSGYGRDFVNSLHGRPTAAVKETKADDAIDPRGQWKILLWPEFAH